MAISGAGVGLATLGLGVAYSVAEPVAVALSALVLGWSSYGLGLAHAAMMLAVVMEDE
jgi:hypothetical protein